MPRNGTRKIPSHQDHLLKIKLCEYFYNGVCNQGQACKFAHALDEVRPIPDQLTETTDGHYYDGGELPPSVNMLEVLLWNQKFHRFAGAPPTPNWVYEMVYDKSIKQLIHDLEIVVNDDLTQDLTCEHHLEIGDDGDDPNLPHPPTEPLPHCHNSQFMPSGLPRGIPVRLQRTCVMCQVNDAVCATLPCGHRTLRYCTECSDHPYLLLSCPVCRATNFRRLQNLRNPCL